MINLIPFIPSILSGAFGLAKSIVTESYQHRRALTIETRELEIERIRAEREAQSEIARERLAVADADSYSVRNQKNSYADEALRLLLATLLAFIVLDPHGAKPVLETLSELPVWLMTIYVLACVDILGVRGVFTSIGTWLVRNRKE